MTSQIDLPVTQLYTETMSSPHTHWLADAESKPAPEPLSRIQALVNTVELPDGPDRLADPVDAQPWLVANGLLAAGCRTAARRPRARSRRPRGSARACSCTTRADRRRRPRAFAPLREVATDGTARADFDEHGEVLLVGGRRFGARAADRVVADHPRRPARRHLGAAQGVRKRRMSVGVLRPLPQPRRHLVRDVLVRQQTQEPRVSRSPQREPLQSG